MPNAPQIIYAVEDDPNIRELVLYALESAGFEAHGFETASELFTALKTSRPSLVLLDIMLPDEDGIAILNRLRRDKDTHSIPVIMLTAKTGEFDRIKGLDSGADDYITKPFSVLELMSRIKAVLRRCSVGNDDDADTLALGGINVDTKKHTVTVDGQEVTLTFKEFELLRYMLVNAGIVLTRDKLMDAVWGFDYQGESRTVDMHIKSLRQKLLGEGERIKTIRSMGYKIE